MRFMGQLVSSIPPDFADDTLLPSDSTGATKTTVIGGSSRVGGEDVPGGGLSGFTRKDLKKASKRAAKMARRQEAAAASLRTDFADGEVDDGDDTEGQGASLMLLCASGFITYPRYTARHNANISREDKKK